MRRIYLVSCLPSLLEPFVQGSILGRAQRAGHVEIRLVDLRDYTHDRHRSTDDQPYGGGAGMVMKPAPFFEAVDAIRELYDDGPYPTVVATSPQGQLFTQAIAQDLAERGDLIILCGHYEAMDERVVEHLADNQISIGDYILTGGELPALVITDAVTRLYPGVLGNPESLDEESFDDGLLGYPQYTRPAVYRGLATPDVLLSGDHARIAQWRRLQRLLRTRERRPDLWARLELSAADRKLLEKADADRLTDSET